MTAHSVLVTGASGWVGRSLLHELARHGFAVHASSRRPLYRLPDGVQARGVGLELGPQTDWSDALRGMDTVVHCAARVHVMNDTAPDPLAAYRQVNTAGTATLAAQAAACGVKRFVFLSTAHVNATVSAPGRPLRSDDTPRPDSPYGLSKLEAEAALQACTAATGMPHVILRPPLVVGPGVGGNVRSLLRVLGRRLPLPLASIHNQRSMVGLTNLVDLARTCITHPAAANQVFMVCDAEDLSTPQLLQRLGVHLGKPARLFPFPPTLLQLAGRLARRSTAVRSLCLNLQVDGATVQERLGWQPIEPLDNALCAAARHFQDNQVPAM
jgi:nucleoside-diphosphate-sugar epimerase